MTNLHVFLPLLFLGISTPRTGLNTNLPSPRALTNKVFVDVAVHSPIETLFHVSFGQFLDHDVVLTPSVTNTDASGNPVDIECGNGCSTSGVENQECFPISIPSDESFFVNFECLSFVRSESGVNDDCTNSKFMRTH